MAKLFTPLTLKTITLKNRLAMSPMCQYCAEDGTANDWHFVHYASRAVGGCGLIVFEACAVNPEGRISPADIGLWKDEQIQPLKRIVEFASKQGAVCAIQLSHAGRKGSVEANVAGKTPLSIESGGWLTEAPSDIPYADNFPAPRELDSKGIDKIVRDFGAAAKRAVAAGFSAIEIHAAHGYLIHEFLSPLSNFRNDDYGGSFENRTRILLRILDAVNSNTPFGTPIFARISATDWVRGGWDLEESVRLSTMLRENGADLIDVSSGGLIDGAKVPADFGFQVKFSEEIRNRAKIATAAVGLLTSPQQAETIIVNGQADIVDFGRQLLREPYFPFQAAVQLGAKPQTPPQYADALEV